MNTLVRWAKFNAVGVLGMGVQLAALAGLNRLLHGHYLVATGLALELTLLHNFWWHQRFTWSDRATPGRALWRFHVSNGLVSMCGNLLLTRVLVQGAHLPLLVANLVAIVSCSMANFALSTRWAFAVSSPPKRIDAMRATLVLVMYAFAPSSVHSQAARLALPRKPDKHGGSRSLRIELRDYWTFANPSQHNIMLRFGWMVEEYRD